MTSPATNGGTARARLTDDVEFDARVVGRRVLKVDAAVVDALVGQTDVADGQVTARRRRGRRRDAEGGAPAQRLLLRPRLAGVPRLVPHVVTAVDCKTTTINRWVVSNWHFDPSLTFHIDLKNRTGLHWT